MARGIGMYWHWVFSKYHFDLLQFINFSWCVNDDGKPVPKSAVQYGRPKCRKNEERRRNRRGKHKQTGRRKKQACVQADRSEFNKHVTDLITAEYREQHGQVPGGTLNQNREMIEWKFDQMDINR